MRWTSLRHHDRNKSWVDVTSLNDLITVHRNSTFIHTSVKLSHIRKSATLLIEDKVPRRHAIFEDPAYYLGDWRQVSSVLGHHLVSIDTFTARVSNSAYVLSLLCNCMMLVRVVRLAVLLDNRWDRSSFLLLHAKHASTLMSFQLSQDLCLLAFLFVDLSLSCLDALCGQIFQSLNSQTIYSV